MNREQDRSDIYRTERLLTWAIPIVSFGGILAAVMLEETGLINNTFLNDFRERIDYFYRRRGRVVSKEVIFYLVRSAGESIHSIPPEDVEKFVDIILRRMTDRKILIIGAGRSGLVGRSFAMRLMHLGFDVYVVGEIVTPAFSNRDTMVVFSGSGETNSIVDICEIAKGLGGKVCLVTASLHSRMERIADCVVNVGDLTGYFQRDKTPFELRQITGQYRPLLPRSLR
jgi:6-phospho 3-hexuloisomerase